MSFKEGRKYKQRLLTECVYKSKIDCQNQEPTMFRQTLIDQGNI